MKYKGIVTDPEFNKACKKIAIHPGYIVSKSDKGRHYIGFVQLCNLYGVNPHYATLWDVTRPETFQGRNVKEYHHVYPNYHGRYRQF